MNNNQGPISEFEIDKLLSGRWSDWQLCELIGEGSFASVYKAVRTDEAGTSYSAIKVLPVPQGSKKERYIDEIKIMLSLKGHPNIVSIEDYATVHHEEGDFILIRMELLQPLDKAVAEGDFGEEQAIKVGIDICDALEHCNKKNILHLDIKPSNIFLSNEGHYKLGDFGISRTADELAKGLPSEVTTPNFMGPELYNLLKNSDHSNQSQNEFDSIGIQYDLYSLGMVLYWLRNNQKTPFLPEKKVLSPQDRKDAFLRRMDGEKLPPLKNTSAGLSNVIFKASAYKPQNRYSNPSEMKGDLKRILTHINHEPSVNKWAVRLSAVILIAAIGISGYFSGFFSSDDGIPDQITNIEDENWSEWSEKRKTEDDRNQFDEESRIVYRWWAAQCTKCGTNNPFRGSSAHCHGCGITLANNQGLWKSVFEYTEQPEETQIIFGRENGKYFGNSPLWREKDQYTQYRYKKKE